MKPDGLTQKCGQPIGTRVKRREYRGLVAEWLRRGLQILAPRFDSGRGLQSRLLPVQGWFDPEYPRTFRAGNGAST